MPSSPLYYWIRFPSSPESVEDDQYRLMELGALGAEEVEISPPAVRGFFDNEAGWSGACVALAGQSGLEWGNSPWEDWDRSWRDRQSPVEVTPFLAVCPPWVSPPPHVRHVIHLEAKMAFGTGSHESTRIAALLTEGLELSGKTLLDAGTGTGILSLYPALRGAAFCVGFDIDTVTGPCLHENLILNPPPSGSKVAFYVGTLDALNLGIRFDVIVCNMIRTEVWPHLDAFLAFLKPGGYLVISGQRIEDQSYWKKWFQEKGFKPCREITLEEWWGFVIGKL